MSRVFRLFLVTFLLASQVQAVAKPEQEPARPAAEETRQAKSPENTDKLPCPPPMPKIESGPITPEEIAAINQSSNWTAGNITLGVGSVLAVLGIVAFAWNKWQNKPRRGGEAVNPQPLNDYEIKKIFNLFLEQLNKTKYGEIVYIEDALDAIKITKASEQNTSHKDEIINFWISRTNSFFDMHVDKPEWNDNFFIGNSRFHSYQALSYVQNFETAWNAAVQKDQIIAPYYMFAKLWLTSLILWAFSIYSDNFVFSLEGYFLRFYFAAFGVDLCSKIKEAHPQANLDDVLPKFTTEQNKMFQILQSQSISKPNSQWPRYLLSHRFFTDKRETLMLLKEENVKSNKFLKMATSEIARNFLLSIKKKNLDIHDDLGKIIYEFIPSPDETVCSEVTIQNPHRFIGMYPPSQKVCTSLNYNDRLWSDVKYKAPIYYSRSNNVDKNDDDNRFKSIFNENGLHLFKTMNKTPEPDKTLLEYLSNCCLDGSLGGQLLTNLCSFFTSEEASKRGYLQKAFVILKEQSDYAAQDLRKAICREFIANKSAVAISGVCMKASVSINQLNEQIYSVIQVSSNKSDVNDFMEFIRCCIEDPDFIKFLDEFIVKSPLNKALLQQSSEFHFNKENFNYLNNEQKITLLSTIMLHVVRAQSRNVPLSNKILRFALDLVQQINSEYLGADEQQKIYRYLENLILELPSNFESSTQTVVNKRRRSI